MKIVKVCRECNKYNGYKLYECAFCGANLTDDTLEVNDEEQEKKVEINLEPVEEVKEETIKEEVKEKQQVKKYICPLCGFESTSEWCENCGNLIDFSSAEVVIETSQDKSESRTEEKKEIEFKLNYKNHNFAFVATNEKKTLGRHDFDIINEEELKSISRSHLNYYVKDSKLFIEDTSSYGTYLNGIKIEPNKEVEVNNHDRIKLVFIEMEISF